MKKSCLIVWLVVAFVVVLVMYVLSPNVYEAKGKFAYWVGSVTIKDNGVVVPTGFHVGNRPFGEAVIRQNLAFTESGTFHCRVVERFLKDHRSDLNLNPSEILAIVRAVRLSVLDRGVPVVTVRVRCDDSLDCVKILAAYMEEITQISMSQERSWGMSVDQEDGQGPVHVLQMDRQGHWAGKSFPKIHAAPAGGARTSLVD